MQIRQENSTYTGIRSAIVFLHREAGFQITEVINVSLSIYIKGSHLMNLPAKKKGLRSNEGNKHMKKEVY